jgi:hypothetical protein
MRVILRRERPHPGTQLSFTDADGGGSGLRHRHRGRPVRPSRSPQPRARPGSRTGSAAPRTRSPRTRPHATRIGANWSAHRCARRVVNAQDPPRTPWGFNSLGTRSDVPRAGGSWEAVARVWRPSAAASRIPVAHRGAPEVPQGAIVCGCGRGGDLRGRETRSTTWRLFVDLDEGRLQRLPVYADGTLQASIRERGGCDVGTYLPEPLVLEAWAFARTLIDACDRRSLLACLAKNSPRGA